MKVHVYMIFWFSKKKYALYIWNYIYVLWNIYINFGLDSLFLDITDIFQHF